MEQNKVTTWSSRFLCGGMCDGESVIFYVIFFVSHVSHRGEVKAACSTRKVATCFSKTT